MGTEDIPGRIRLVVLFGGQSAEHDVSCVTAGHVLRAIDSSRYEVLPIGITREGRWVRAADAASTLEGGIASIPAGLDPSGPEVDPLPTLEPSRTGEVVVVLPLLHGPMGEDGTVQGLLELADVPYVGAGVLASALAMDKIMAKEVLSVAQIPQAAFAGLRADQVTDASLEEAVGRLGLPIFVKPANLGSSIGVSRARTLDDLGPAVDLALSYDEWVVLEEAIDGREIEVALLGNQDPRASVPGEIRSASEFYDYEDKYLDGRAETLIPADLSTAETATVRELAIRAYEALRVEGLARVDFFFEEQGRGFLLNEVNTIPGFTPISMYPKLWEASGVGYPALIDELVKLAVDRHDRRAGRRSTSRRPSLHREGPLRSGQGGPGQSAGS